MNGTAIDFSVRVRTGVSLEAGDEVRATVLDLDLVEHQLILSLRPDLLLPTINTRVLRSASKR